MNIVFKNNKKNNYEIKMDYNEVTIEPSFSDINYCQYL